MPIRILMPALSPTMTEGNLVKWCKKEGDYLKSGDILAEIETDKATMEVEVVDEGTLARIVVKEGTEKVPVHSLIALVLEEGEGSDSLEQESSEVEVRNLQEKQSPFNLLKSTPSLQQNSTERILASPLAKRLAHEKNIPLSCVQGTGPKGRIVSQDIQRIESIPLQSFEQNYRDEPLSTMRKIIGQRLQESKQNIPHFYISMDCHMDKLLELKKSLPIKLSINDFLVKACALALQKYPKINAAWHDTFVRYFTASDVCVAVSIEGGLITPIIKNAEKKSLQHLSQEIKNLANRAREGKLTPEEYQGGSFTLSNLGMYGVSSFTAIINPPQACILAAAGIRKVITLNEEHKTVEVQQMTTLTLSADHRIVDGAYAAQFLEEIKTLLETPLHMLVG